jgi:hypothetical protein
MFFEDKPLADRTTGQLGAIMKNSENTFAVTWTAKRNET